MFRYGPRYMTIMINPATIMAANGVAPAMATCPAGFRPIATTAATAMATAAVTLTCTTKILNFGDKARRRSRQRVFSYLRRAAQAR